MVIQAMMVRFFMMAMIVVPRLTPRSPAGIWMRFSMIKRLIIMRNGLLNVECFLSTNGRRRSGAM